MILKPCTASDLSALRDLSEFLYEETFRDYCSEQVMSAYLSDAFTTQKLLGELSNPDSFFFYIEQEGEIAGYIKLNIGAAQTEPLGNCALELQRIYIDSRFKGKGIGTRALEEICRVARLYGKSFVWLGVWEKNKPALDFYAKNGFLAFDEHVFIMGDEHQRDFLLKKELENI